jgi:5'-3' exonuclease
MGIPSYFSYIKKRYDVKQLLHKCPPSHENIERLFLDLNGILHPCCHDVLKKIENSENPMSYTRQCIEADIYRTTIQYISDTLDEVKPTKLLFIGIDGVAPRAKMFQQRKRRFKSQQDKKCDPELKNKKSLWDTNAITPGTEFMCGLNSALKESTVLKLKMKEMNIKIIISDSQVASEGEHKLVNYIKKYPIDGINIIHGLDADLIMLSLLCHPQNIYLLRHDLVKKTKLFFHINTFVYYVKMHFDSALTEDVEKKKLIDEYIFLCFFMGNDFLPHHYGFEISDEGIDFNIEKYCAVKNKKKGYFLTRENGDINQEFLCDFLYEISKEEESLVERRMERMVYKNLFRHGNKPEDKFKFWPDYNRKLEKSIAFGSKNWKTRYYTHINDQLQVEPPKTNAKIPVTSTHELKNDMVIFYLQGLVWNLKYYKFGCVANKWHYPYLHAPCLIDVYNYLLELKINVNDLLKKDEHVYSCFEQLLFVLPPKNFDLLPVSWKHSIFRNKLNKKIFPTSFQLDPVGNIFRWQCPPILPYFPDKSFLKLVDSCKLSENELKRSNVSSEYLL